MKTNTLKIAILAIIGSSFVMADRFLDSTPVIKDAVRFLDTVAWKSTLPCGQCIDNGYVFCISGGETSSSDPNAKTTCCKDSTTNNC